MSRRRKKTPRPSLSRVRRRGRPHTTLHRFLLYSILSRSVHTLLQRGLLFAPRLLLAALMNERQRQASVTMRTRLVASECHLRDRLSLSRIAALLKFSMLRPSPFRLTSKPSPHGHANHLAHDSAMVSALLDRSHASHIALHTKNCARLGAPRAFSFQVAGLPALG